MHGAFLINQGVQSSTLRSYVSAIKHTLTTDGYKWDDDKVLLQVLIRACKIENDVVKTRFPVHFSLLEMILFEIQRKYQAAPYLSTMYIYLFCLAYYGMMRIGELTEGNHALKAKDVHIGSNKDKILLILYSSKTHDKESPPQKIRISNSEITKGKQFFCPFTVTQKYARFRGNYISDSEQFFIFAGRSPVKPFHVRNTLKDILKLLNLNHKFYQTQFQKR